MTENDIERDKKYPLYPHLSEAGQEEAQRIIDKFKENLSKAAKEAIGDLYVDIGCYVESDSWTNYRNSLMNGLKNYNNRKEFRYPFDEIRAQIYKEFREDIIADLNQDLLKEVEELKKIIKYYQESQIRN